MTSTEQQQHHHHHQQQQQQQQQHSPAAGESYRGAVSATAPSDMSTTVSPVAAGTIDDEPNERELNLTLPAQTAAAPAAVLI